MSKKIVLFSLQTFSNTGGIQKMTRTLAHSLHNICSNQHWDFKLISLYDKDTDLMPRYLPQANFKGFGRNKIGFILQNVFKADKPDVIILSHINLALVGLLIKLLSPKTKIWLIAHGIEVWCPLSFNKRKLLNSCDKVLCVSRFTLEQMKAFHHLPAEKCEVLNNVLDPFMPLPAVFSKPAYLLQRYGLNEKHKVILSLARLASTEQYKGHDRVLKAVVQLKKQYHNIKYILAGSYDKAEGDRIKKLITDYDITEQVILTGFIAEQEIPDHFLMADLFVLPSKKEGFGIVFIEALSCGLPVICGNTDGSVDAIRNGELGVAINPDSDDEIESTIAGSLAEPLTLTKRKELQQQCMAHFSERNYIEIIQKMLIND
ncbi:glycosyltransferase family 1 protein [Mucilaginibacter conchicola]|uniref:Glycosyltransferase family 1 protein n=1 Tax=Mucilaginibacter conchicola TaxID=2303333 RepID=A0A372NZH0_9SPHI|nr:glycosyltransferase family 4 protein [Mucilaginibacter conchicola]RFZ95311.1 glycosyltransferase family 1 protein [Mucilaginibacter conchicola]